MKTLLLSLLCSVSLLAQVNFEMPKQQGAKPWTHLDFNTSKGQFQFAIVSDRTGGHRQGVFMEGVKKINLLQPEFVMTVGDMIEGYTTDRDRITKEWEEFDGFVKQLDMPFFYVPGNHDYINPVMAEIWKERYGPDYYYFKYEGVLFLCLNSEEKMKGSNNGSISKKQSDWVKNVLEENDDVRWTLVFMHQPLWVQDNDSDQWGTVEELLQDRKHTVFVGHRHNYVAYERNNSNYYILATTGGGSPLKGAQLGQFDHFVWITMTKEGPIMANLALDGVHDDQLFTEDAKNRIAEYFQENNVALDKWLTDEQQVSLKLTNPYDFPIKVKINPKFNWKVGTDVPVDELEINPNSVETTYIAIQPRSGKSVETGDKLYVNLSIYLPETKELPKVHFPITKVIERLNE